MKIGLEVEWKLVCREANLFSVGKWLLYDFLRTVAKRLLRRGGAAHEPIDFTRLPIQKRSRGRVLIASQDCSFTSGAYRSCVAMARELRHVHGYDVIVVLAYNNEAECDLQQVDVPYCVIPSERWLVDVELNGRKSYRQMATMFEVNHRAIRSWCRLIREFKPDIVHVNSMSCYVGGLAALKMGVPVVWHMRDLLEEDHGLKIYNRDLGLKLIGYARKMIAVSDCVAAKYTPVFGGDKVVRVYNGVDPERFYRPEKTIFNNDVATLIFLGAFQITKGHVEFAKACAELYRRGNRAFRVWFVGGGNEQIKKMCDNEFSKAGMSHLVTYWGRQSRPEDFLEKADIAFMCARCEAFGRVTVEMMLSGCLVIGSNTGGTPELVRDGATGILFDRSNIVESLTDATERAFANPDKSRMMAASGRSFAINNLTTQKNAVGVASVYKEVFAS